MDVFLKTLGLQLGTLGFQIGIAIAIIPVIVKAFATVEDALSDQARQKIVSLLNAKLDPSRQTSQEIPEIGSIFDAVFGARHFSVFCFIRILIIALISYVLVSFSVLYLEFDKLENIASVKNLAIYFVVLNVPIEYLCLGYTRYLTRRLERPPSDPALDWGERWNLTPPALRWWERWNVAPKTKPVRRPSWPVLRYLLQDTGLKVLSTGWITGIFFRSSLYFDPKFKSFPYWLLGPWLTVWQELNSPALVIPVVSIVLSALWIWIYVGVMRNIGAIYKMAIALKWTLDVEKHPVKTLGVLTAFICSAVYFFILVGSALVVQA